MPTTILQARQLCAGSAEVGLTVADPRLLARINEAQRRLINFYNVLVRREEYDLPQLVYVARTGDTETLVLDEPDATKLQMIALWREENNLEDQAAKAEALARKIVSENLTAAVEAANKVQWQNYAAGAIHTKQWYWSKLGLDIPTLAASSEKKLRRLVDRAALWIYRRIFEYQLIERNRVRNGVPSRAAAPSDDTSVFPVPIEYEIVRLVAQAFLSEAAVQADANSQAAGQQMLFTLLTGEAVSLLTRTLDAELEALRHTTYTALLTSTTARTMGRAKAQIALEVPGAIRLSDNELGRLVNSAEQRLVESGKWKGMLKDAEIEIDAEGVVTMPPEIETVLAATINRRPALIKGQWYEFIPGGPGFQEAGCSCVRQLLIDRGNNEATGERLYWIAGCKDGDTLHVRAKRRFVYKADDDLMQMRNYSALKNAVNGIMAEGFISGQSLNPQLATFHWSVAGKILSNELDEYLGDSAQGSMPVQMGSFAAFDIPEML